MANNLQTVYGVKRSETARATKRWRKNVLEKFEPMFIFRRDRYTNYFAVRSTATDVFETHKSNTLRN